MVRTTPKASSNTGKDKKRTSSGSKKKSRKSLTYKAVSSNGKGDEPVNTTNMDEEKEVDATNNDIGNENDNNAVTYYPPVPRSTQLRGAHKRKAPSTIAGRIPQRLNRYVKSIAQPHVESFDFFTGPGLQAAVQDLRNNYPHEAMLDIIDASSSKKKKKENDSAATGTTGTPVRFWIDSAHLEPKPYKPIERRKSGFGSSNASFLNLGNGGSVSTSENDKGITAQRQANEKFRFPAECRELGINYTAKLIVRFARRIGKNAAVETYEKSVGDIPIMLRSKHCNLHGLSPKQLVAHGEEANEFGGVFICNGMERMIRLIQLPKRNHPMAITRSSFEKRGPTYTDKGIMIRGVRPDQSANTNVLHYRKNHAPPMFKVLTKKNEYFIPVGLLLRACSPDATDRQILHDILLTNDAMKESLASSSSSTVKGGSRGAQKQSPNGSTSEGAFENLTRFIIDSTEGILRSYRELVRQSDGQLRDGYTQGAALAYLGSRFRVALDVPEGLSDEAVGVVFLQRYVLVHLSHSNVGYFDGVAGQSDAHNNGRLNGDARHGGGVPGGEDKYLLLIFMIHKLFTFASGNIAADNPDTFMHHELLLPGFLILNIVKEKLDELLFGVKLGYAKEVRRVLMGQSRSTLSDLKSMALFKRLIDRQGTIGAKVQNFLSTGNIVSSSGLDLQQVSGFTIVAEKLNYLRYISHFRSVHRGAFFATMKTTSPRKLLPESWGYLCPVHTPDGSPCGLLQHLASEAKAVTTLQSRTQLQKIKACLYNLGVTSLSDSIQFGSNNNEIELSTNVALMNDDDGEKEDTESDHQSQEDRGTQLVFLDGAVIGTLPSHLVGKVARTLRQLKVHASSTLASDGVLDFHNGNGKNTSLIIPPNLEIAHLKKPAYPGLFLHTQPARLVRPVINLRYESHKLVEELKTKEEDENKINDSDSETKHDHSGGKKKKRIPVPELIGPLGQPYMEIACTLDDVVPKLTTHAEISPMNMLSIIASLTPFSDFNQSPRNMYQCQMGKQTMGTPAHSLDLRRDNKMYRIQTPQVPIVQNARQGLYSMDDYPNGTNAIVAVISYTGYDMEDAMILNKASCERGFAHASVYKTKMVDLGGNDARRRATKVTSRFGDPKGQYADFLDADGLPRIGVTVNKGDPIYSVIDGETGETRATKHKETEPAIVEKVSLLGVNPGSDPCKRVSIKFRYNRNPIVGDKFSSRHGQKGVLSIKWPQEDMPFTESGMVPDIIINPHAFPSRMTIGMLIESMAGKGGSLAGKFQDATPFQYHEENGKRAYEHFGEQLRKHGYNYHGSEILTSGTSGRQMKADIFIGIVYYQRLRHMVSDKSQVRSIGGVDQLTRQPIKGRKRGGGIRFGEMERDSMLAHGSAFLLHDRLLDCSDTHRAWMCVRCKSLLSTMNVPGKGSSKTAGFSKRGGMKAVVCRTCGGLNGSSAECQEVTIPYVFLYLANELA
eukprot:g3552.t1